MGLNRPADTETMIGMQKTMSQQRRAVLGRHIPGDLVECDVWRQRTLSHSHSRGSRWAYSRNLIFANGATMQQVFDSVVDRTRSRPTGSPWPNSPPRCTSSLAPPTPTTTSARPATTCVNSAANGSSTSPAVPAATTSRRWPRAPSPPCSPCAIRSSAPSSQGSVAPRWDANPRTGPASTVTTNESASTCKGSSPISPSKHR
ncbi:hypothetical protein H7H69_12910 [Mycobacterium heckeshornense]|nr:hypothetical protein [Mycobacterium heckeshornense]